MTLLPADQPAPPIVVSAHPAAVGPPPRHAPAPNAIAKPPVVTSVRIADIDAVDGAPNEDTRRISRDLIPMQHTSERAPPLRCFGFGHIGLLMAANLQANLRSAD